MAKAKTKAEPAAVLEGDPGDEHLDPPRLLWKVRMGEYPRLLVEAVDRVGAAEAYRLKLNLRRLDLPTEVLPAGD